eukprot:TRINITY_DN26158_c0_g1_i1.p1 TRINITY_DN26158_c0_g1~~TRINITY_DN26158_c0_g1_i1.p1  ORF type:complete len:252 (+),score=57.77 TRINITY_DN26158_c0_g1_i1:202-957(+)
MRGVLGDYIFAGLIHQVIQNPEELFTYKKQFTGYVACQSLFSYAFKIFCRDLYSWSFCKRTGKVYYTKYDFTLKEESIVPFRLSPNLQYFITPIGIEGPFAGSITAIAYALQLKMKHLKGYLKIYYRDMWREVPWGENVEDNCRNTIDTINKLVDRKVMQTVTSKKFEGINSMSEEEYSFNGKVYEIISEARDEKRLSEMPLEWAPWFCLQYFNLMHLSHCTISIQYLLSLIHICRCRRYAVCRSRWSPYH